MKIAFVAQPIDPVLPPRQNSIGIIIYEIARRLARSCAVTVCLRGDLTRKKVETVEGIDFRYMSMAPDRSALRFLSRIPTFFSPKRPLFGSSLYYLGYALQVALSLRAEKCDVIHIVNFSQFVPIVRAFNPRSKIVLHMECEWLNQLDRRMIEKRIRNIDLIVGCSGYITQKIRARFPQCNGLCRTVYNGVDVDRFFPVNRNDRRRNKDGHKRILFIGRMSPEKGVHVLLNAFQKVVKHYPKAGLQLIGPRRPAPAEYIVPLSDDPKVLGLAPFYSKGYLAHIERQISLGLTSHVTFVDNLPYSHLVKHYRDADIFIFPSVWHEPFGMPIIEAMASGVPVIATRSGGITELVEDGKSGLLVERDNAPMLAEAILSLLEDEKLRESMGNDGRRRVQEFFTWDMISEKLLGYYYEICSKG